MNIKTQELVTAGYALAKGLDVESAKLVTQLADELAVQRVRADELNKQVVCLAVENTQMLRLLTDISDNHGEFVNEADDYMYASVPLDYVSEINMYVSRDVNAENPFAETDAFLANIQAQGVEMFVDDCENDVVFVEPEDAEHYELMAEHAREFADKIRKGEVK
ncbi:hypothetical protein ACEU59_09750 [Buttiauxella noackiae]|uniref:hypothetical protein n=1 Tax=Buttiauxella noackiae TaxID=82992 RepID=UPI0035A712A4